MIKSPTAKSKIFFLISIVLILVSIVSLCVRGLNFGIDFKGGTTIQFDLDKTKFSSDVEKTIRDIVKDVAKTNDITVQKTGENGVSVKGIVRQRNTNGVSNTVAKKCANACRTLEKSALAATRFGNAQV